MANALYDLARQAFLDGNLDWAAHDFKAVLVDTGAYTVNLATHDFLDDIPVGARIATSANLGTKTSTNGVADAADVTFTAVTGASVEAVVIYRDTAVATTSELVAYIDTATGLPTTPSGGDITVTWNASGIFKL